MKHRYSSIVSAMLLTALAAALIMSAPVLSDDIRDDHGSSINIEVTTHLGDKQTFREGDRLSFLVTLDQDAYLLMIYEDAAHNLIQVIPNEHRDNNYFESGLFIAVPGGKDPFRFVVKRPFGQETLWVFASDKPFPTLQGKSLANGLKQLSQNLSAVKATLQRHASQSLYAEAKTTIYTEPGS
jgi:hypothetical protein